MRKNGRSVWAAHRRTFLCSSCGGGSSRVPWHEHEAPIPRVLLVGAPVLPSIDRCGLVRVVGQARGVGRTRVAEAITSQRPALAPEQIADNNRGAAPLDSGTEIPHLIHMCNRFRSIREWSDIPRHLHSGPRINFEFNPNVAPTELVPVLVAGEGIVLARFGIHRLGSG